jgi:LPS export ABC transporter permease LptG/LPS export ABC transporter permease LptF
MLKIFDRYMLREVAAPFGIGLLVYSFVLLMNQLLVFPELFIARGVPLLTTLKLLGYLIPAIMAFTVPMAVLMGVLAGLSRMSSDAEITAFKTLGIGHLRILRPLLIFAFFGWLATSVLAMWTAPIFNFKFQQTFAAARAERIQMDLSPREFNEIPGTMIYFQDVAPTREWTNVFIYAGTSEVDSRILLARRGNLNVSVHEKRAMLELHDAVQHSVVLDEPDRYSVSLYDRIEEEINAENFFGFSGAIKRVREMTYGELTAGLREINARLSALLREKAALAREAVSSAAARRAENAVAIARAGDEIRAHQVEIHKKFALPFACWIFVFLGLPLGVSTKKGGRTSGFTLSLVIILFYYVFITAGEKFAMDGRIPPWLGIWAGNILFAVLGARLFAHSAREIPFFARLVGRRPAIARSTLPHPAPSSSSVPAGRRFRPKTRFPNILDRYILRKYLSISVFTMSSLLAIFAIVTFFEQIDNVYRNHKSIGLLLSYVWFRFPEFIHYGLPVTALTATLLAFGLMTKSNEMTAMKACGVSLYRTVLPSVVMGLVFGLLAFQLQERILPRSAKQADEAWSRLNSSSDEPANPNFRRWTINRTRDRIFHYGYFDPQRATWSKLSIIDLDPPNWSIKRRVYAAKAELRGDALHLENGWLREFDKGTDSRFDKFEALDLPFAKDKELFYAKNKAPAQMTFGELRRSIEEVRSLGFDTRRMQVQASNKLAFPFVALVMTFLGLSFAFVMGKRGALVGVGISLVIAIAYWVLIGVFLSLGNVGFLSVFLAAWGPNLIFGLLGFYLFLRVRT